MQHIMQPHMLLIRHPKSMPLLQSQLLVNKPIMSNMDSILNQSNMQNMFSMLNPMLSPSGQLLDQFQFDQLFKNLLVVDLEFSNLCAGHNPHHSTCLVLLNKHRDFHMSQDPKEESTTIFPIEPQSVVLGPLTLIISEDQPSTSCQEPQLRLQLQ